MSPILALFLCTAFVLFMLNVDRKQSFGVSGALWIPTAWVFYVAGKPLGVWLGQESIGSESGSSIDRVFLIVLLSLALLVLWHRGQDWVGPLLKENLWLSLLIIYMLASIFWSDMVFVSFKRWVREFIALAMALLVLSETA